MAASTSPGTARRSYADPCAVARALDAVGERWALLVVRELSLGPRRFGQLRAGLPGMSPNVLSQRLRELEDAGVVARYELPPPSNTTVYELSEEGQALDPVLQALGRWGATRPPVGGRPMSAVSFLRSLRVLVRPDAADTTFGVRIGVEPFVVRVAGGAVQLDRGEPPAGVPLLAGDVDAVRAVLLERVDPHDVDGLTVAGDRRAIRRLATLFRMPDGGRGRLSP